MYKVPEPKHKFFITKQVTGYEWIQALKMYSIKTDGAEVRICFMTEDIIRVRSSFDQQFEEESYALSLTAWPDRLDPILGELRKRIEPLKIDVAESDEFLTFQTKSLKLKISKKPYSLEIINQDGISLQKELPGRAHKTDLQGRVYHFHNFDSVNDCFYGFGETTGTLNKRKKSIKLKPMDSLGHDAQQPTPLYKHIPFYIKINKSNRHALGLFYHNTYEANFQMGSERSGYWPEYTSYCANGGDLDLFILNGPKISEVVERYTDLTGKSAFTPLESLGYLGSTMFYVELPERCDEEIIDFVDKNHDENIPISNFHLSSGYTMLQDKKKRCVFTWNKKKFPDPKDFFQKVMEKGVSVSPNIKPGILTCHPLYEDFKESKAFIMQSSQKEPHVGQWWGGSASFIDFTSPKGREAWKRHMKQQLIRNGTTSIWNDNCEYEQIDDPGVICDFEGKGGTHQKLKVVQSVMMAHSSYEAIHEEKPGIRPYLINRAGFAGIQKYASTWAGDNYTEWKTIKFNISTILNMGLSGVANQGCDIGGFWGPAPQSELLLRWVQNGIFQPRFSIHSCNTDNTVTEPWMYEEVKGLIVEAINFRHRLIPYLYSLLYEAHRKGSPIMRPLIYQFQDDLNCYDTFDTFMLGSSLLVANVLEKDMKVRRIYFPKGCNWYDWWSTRVYEGGSTIQLPVELGSIPLFLRGNAIIPTTSHLTSINDQKIDNLSIYICGDSSGEFLLFEDDGKTYNYRKGGCLETLITVRRQNQLCYVNINKNGNYPSAVKKMELFLKRSGKAPSQILLNGKQMPFYLIKQKWEDGKYGWYVNHSLGLIVIKYENVSEKQEFMVNLGPRINFKEEYQ